MSNSPRSSESVDMHADMKAFDVRITGVESSVTRLSGTLEHYQSVLSSKIENVASSIYARLDQQQRDTRPNTFGWIMATIAGAGVSLTIGGAFGGLWKASVDDRFLALLSAVRDVKIEMVAGDKELRGSMLTRDEYASRSAIEVARRQDQFTAMADRLSRDESEIVRLRDSAATKDDRSIIIGRFQEQNDRIREDIRVLRERMDFQERRVRQ